MERRSLVRIPSSLTVKVTDGDRIWQGTCINLSSEGALLRLGAPWDGAWDIDFEVESPDSDPVARTRARVVRASSPDQGESFLAIRFAVPGIFTPSS